MPDAVVDFHSLECVQDLQQGRSEVLA